MCRVHGKEEKRNNFKFILAAIDSNFEIFTFNISFDVSFEAYLSVLGNYCISSGSATNTRKGVTEANYQGERLRGKVC